MFHISSQDRIEIAKRVAYTLSQCEAGTDARTVLCRAYCRFMPDKTDWQGYLMADQIISYMGVFQEHYATAQEAPEAYAASQLAALIAELPLQAQCAALDTLAGCLEKFDGKALRSCMSAADQERFLAEFSRRVKIAPYTGEVSERARDQLLLRAAKAAERSMSEYALDRMTDTIARGQDPTYAALHQKMDENLVTAVAAMIIYTMVHSGELACAPEYATLDQVVFFTCRSAEMEQIRNAYWKKLISRDTWYRRLKAAWSVVLILLMAAVLAGGAAAVMWARNCVGAVCGILAVSVLIGMLLGPVNETMLAAAEKLADDVSDVHLRLPAAQTGSREVLFDWLKNKAAAPAATKDSGAAEEEEIADLPFEDYLRETT